MPTPPRSLVLWDIDGTILRSNGAGLRAMQRVSRRLFGDLFSWDGVETAGWLDPLIYQRLAEINNLDNHADHHQTFHDHYIAELEHEFQVSRRDVRALPGVAAAVELLDRRHRQIGDVVQGLLTGNYTRAVPIKLAAVGLDPAMFLINALGDEADSRPALVPVALRKFRDRYAADADPRRVIVIGDTPRDVHCAKSNGCLALAVATGSHGAHELRQAGADVTVPDLADPQPLLDLLDAPASAPGRPR
ncbi:MAG: haloacid dehalogenase-like hydrolase [Phycisphaeraceae bacterium]|nr:haloacid dehalogenase-like hydrolase [Phycisphaeraceae bacterium]